ncbi:MAG: phosphatase PAP2 family protein [Planctomycetota bacterium]
MKYPPGYYLLPWTSVLAALSWGLFEVAAVISESEARSLDDRVILLMRQTDHPERLIGPLSLEEAVRDFTALGGYAVLVTITICFAAFARAELGRDMFRFFVVTVVGGFLSGVVLKELVQRHRPSIVPHLSHVSGSTSFPSSHAMMSVIVYVTIGLLLAQLSRSPALRHLLIGLPFGVSLLVGVSRVCMGVHFPSDVLAGWTFGLMWIWAMFALRGRRLSIKT